jgi:hypothetical protein
MTAAGLSRDCRGTGVTEVLEGPQFAPVRQLRQSPLGAGNWSGAGRGSDDRPI